MSDPQYRFSLAPGQKNAHARRRCLQQSLLIAAVLAVACGGPAPTYTPRDAALRDLPLFFYVPDKGPGSARAFVFFYGNDVGFWQPHRDLAAKLASRGYSVTGFDIRPLLASLPEAEPARDSAFAARMTSIIGASRRELGADSLPIVLAGHSIGAEIAIWTGSHVPLPRLAGVLALSPGSRSHLRVTFNDIANSTEPHDPESFSVADAVRGLPPDVPLALVRGDHDKFRFADSAIMVAGGARAQRYSVRFASHSLRRITLALPVVSQALEWLLSSPATRRTP